MSDGPLALWLDVASDAVVLIVGLIFIAAIVWLVLEWRKL